LKLVKLEFSILVELIKIRGQIWLTIVLKINENSSRKLLIKDIRLTSVQLFDIYFYSSTILAVLAT